VIISVILKSYYNFFSDITDVTKIKRFIKISNKYASGPTLTISCLHKLLPPKYILTYSYITQGLLKGSSHNAFQPKFCTYFTHMHQETLWVGNNAVDTSPWRWTSTLKMEAARPPKQWLPTTKLHQKTATSAFKLVLFYQIQRFQLPCGVTVRYQK